MWVVIDGQRSLKFRIVMSWFLGSTASLKSHILSLQLDISIFTSTHPVLQNWQFNRLTLTSRSFGLDIQMYAKKKNVWVWTEWEWDWLCNQTSDVQGSALSHGLAKAKHGWAEPSWAMVMAWSQLWAWPGDSESPSQAVKPWLYILELVFCASHLVYVHVGSATYICAWCGMDITCASPEDQDVKDSHAYPPSHWFKIMLNRKDCSIIYRCPHLGYFWVLFGRQSVGGMVLMLTWCARVDLESLNMWSSFGCSLYIWIKLGAFPLQFASFSGIWGLPVMHAFKGRHGGMVVGTNRATARWCCGGGCTFQAEHTFSFSLCSSVQSHQFPFRSCGLSHVYTCSLGAQVTWVPLKGDR